jgi:hypothetical protein
MHQYPPKQVQRLTGSRAGLDKQSSLYIFVVVDTESWHLISNGRNGPPARHKHGMVLHDDSIWVYGGMTDLQERSDFWRFDTGNFIFKYYLFSSSRAGVIFQTFYFIVPRTKICNKQYLEQSTLVHRELLVRSPTTTLSMYFGSIFI